MSSLKQFEGGEVFYLGEGRGGAVLQCHDAVDDVEDDAMRWSCLQVDGAVPWWVVPYWVVEHVAKVGNVIKTT